MIKSQHGQCFSLELYSAVPVMDRHGRAHLSTPPPPPPPPSEPPPYMDNVYKLKFMTYIDYRNVDIALALTVSQ